MNTNAIDHLEDIEMDEQHVITTSTRSGIRRQILNFFTEEFGLSNDCNPVDRLVEVMTDLYDSTSPEQWLSYASFLLLLSFESTNDFTGKIFKRMLDEEDKYKPLNFSPKNIQGDVVDPMVPLFALERTQTQKSCRSQMEYLSQKPYGLHNLHL